MIPKRSIEEKGELFKMNDSVKFSYMGTAKVTAHRGAGNLLGEIASRYGSRAFVIVSRSVSEYPCFQEAFGSVKERLSACLYPYSAGEPSPKGVKQATAAAEAFGADVVIGIGGGSVLDLGKAVSALVPNGGSVVDYLEGVGTGARLKKDPLPLIALPTTSGTGSEVTKNAVITDTERGYKKSLRDVRLVAKEVVIDSEFLVGAPLSVSVYSGFDALTQLIESYTSNKANVASRLVCKKGLCYARVLPEIYRDPGNHAYREEMAWAALLSGVCLADTGLGAVHGIAASVGAHTGEGHGKVCAVLLPHVMRVNMAVSRSQYAEIARILFGKEEVGADGLVQKIANMALRMGVPRDFRYLDVSESRFERILSDIYGSSMRYNPVSLVREEWERVLRPLFFCEAE